jgi:hypothetical protein
MSQSESSESTSSYSDTDSNISDVKQVESKPNFTNEQLKSRENSDRVDVFYKFLNEKFANVKIDKVIPSSKSKSVSAAGATPSNSSTKKEQEIVQSKQSTSKPKSATAGAHTSNTRIACEGCKKEFSCSYINRHKKICPANK